MNTKVEVKNQSVPERRQPQPGDVILVAFECNTNLVPCLYSEKVFRNNEKRTTVTGLGDHHWDEWENIADDEWRFLRDGESIIITNGHEQ